jgi:uncharacterized protein YecE (DUF72 family)
VFYPRKLPQKRELAFAADTFNTVEINGTFYSLQLPQSFIHWASETPDDFLFAVKGSRYITHMLRLNNIGTALANFFASGVLGLGRKLGPFLWQFPPNFQFNADKMEQFFETLPRDTRSAARLARKCDRRIISKPATKAACDIPLRHAVEVRHQTFVDPVFIKLLRRHRVALVCADTVAWPRLMDLTTDFIYCRLHGSEELYVSGYDDVALDDWAARVVAWLRGSEPVNAERVIPCDAAKRRTRDVFVYFDNDAKVHAPFDAQALQRRVAKLLGEN